MVGYRSSVLIRHNLFIRDCPCTLIHWFPDPINVDPPFRVTLKTSSLPSDFELSFFKGFYSTFTLLILVSHNPPEELDLFELYHFMNART